MTSSGEVITLPFISDEDEYDIRFNVLVGALQRAIEPFYGELTEDEIKEALDEAIFGIGYEEFLEGENE